VPVLPVSPGEGTEQRAGLQYPKCLVTKNLGLEEVAEAVQRLLCKCEDLSSTPVPQKEKKNQGNWLP
jgi:signal recognition particle subunit SEC65